jgi:diamine N-acetyltransferase
MLLKGNKITLRAIEPTDLEILYKWENDTTVWTVSDTVTPFSRHVLLQYIETCHLDIYTNKQLRLMIDTADNTTIGCIDIFDFDPKNRRAGIGILIGEIEYRAKGFAADALKTVIEYCFTTLHLHQLYCNITTDNTNSLALFKKQGFSVIGCKKEWILNDNEWLDEFTLQLIKE